MAEQPISEVTAGFRDAIRSYGLTPPEVIEPGKWTRFPGYGKGPRNTAGSCLLFTDLKGGVIYDHSTGLEEIWFIDSKARSQQQIRQYRKQAEQAKIEQQNADAEKHKQAAKEAQDMWDRAQPALDMHVYLAHKGIRPHNLRATLTGELLAPVHDRDGQLSSVQRIYERDGKFEKRYHKGGATGGDHHFVIGGPDDYLSGNTEGMETIYIAEGVATAASIHEVTGYPAVVAFQANSLELVAKLAHERYPEAKIVVCADNDVKTEADGKSNPGVEAATKAAKAVEAYLTIPPAPDGESMDFNDLAMAEGADAVKETIKRAMECPPMEPVAFLQSANDDEIPQENYPLDVLLEVIRNAITEVQNFTQTPVAMAAASTMSVLSLAAQGSFNIERTSGLDGPISLFQLTIADSGERKTTNDKKFLKPIYEFEEQADEQGKEDKQIYNANLAAWKAKKDAFISTIKESIKSSGKSSGNPKFEEKGNRGAYNASEPSMTSNKHIMKMDQDHELEAHAKNEPEKPKIPHLIYQDATPEALLWGLHENWPSGGVMTSEGNLVFGSHGMSDTSIQKNLAAYNKLWDGDPVRVDRRTSESFTVRDARLTMGIQVQEEPLREFMNRKKGLARDSGFLARCLFTYPESTKGTRMFREAPEHWPKLHKYHDLIRRILDTNPSADEKPSRRTLRFDDEAKRAWIKFQDTIEYDLGPNRRLAEIHDLASKAADNVARVAALFQIAIDGPDDMETVGEQATQKAIAVVGWHLNEALRFFGQVSTPQHIQDSESILRWAQKHNVSGITRRDLSRKASPVALRKDRNRLDEALRDLEERGQR